MARKVDPNKFDYDRDNIPGTTKDREMGQKDSDRNGKVSADEEATFTKAQGESTITSETVGDKTITKSESNAAAPVEPAITAGELGYSGKFLKKNPDVARAVALATKYKWTEEQFVRYVEQETAFGRRRTDSQALFDININGAKAEDYRKQITDTAASLTRNAALLGINISENNILEFARKSIRDGLTGEDTVEFFSNAYKAPKAGVASVGEAGLIQTGITDMAREYGVQVDPATLANKVKQGLAQGTNWRTWLDGQRDVYRNSAKSLYPKVADQFDKFTLQDILDPYLSVASQALGIPVTNMKLDDKSGKWTKPLSGTTGAMSQDEWMTTLKTDKIYGYGKTSQAKSEASSLANSILSVFGMA
jgi:hypothetical protein